MIIHYEKSRGQTFCGRRFVQMSSNPALLQAMALSPEDFEERPCKRCLLGALMGKERSPSLDALLAEITEAVAA